MTLFIILTFTIGFILGIFARSLVQAKSEKTHITNLKFLKNTTVTFSDDGLTHKIAAETSKGLRLYPPSGYV